MLTSLGGFSRGFASAATPAPRHTVESAYGDVRSLAYRFRQRRFALLQPVIERIIARKGHCRIADIGGTEYYWQIAGDFIARAAVEIHLINLEKAATIGGKFTTHAGDACRLAAFADDSFDLVHSNSVIEHVGDWRRMTAMADEVRRLAPAYFVQTPNFWFPYEPHFRAPFFHWLPEPVRARLLMRFNLGFGGRRATLDAAMQGLQSSNLIGEAQMAALFPDARIAREKVFCLTKSLMAIREERYGDEPSPAASTLQGQPGGTRTPAGSVDHYCGA